MKTSHQIKRGVSLHSFQEEYFLQKMTLEDCIAACAKFGALGIESIAEQMMPGFPHLSEAFYDQWHGWMEKYGTIPTCHDSFLDTKRYKGRMMNDDEMIKSIIRDLKHASKLGCPTMRILMITPPHIIEKASPYAEQYNVKMGVEIHAPFTFDHKDVLRLYEMMERVNSPYLGFIPDTGIFVKRYPRICSQNFIRRGANQKIVQYICEAYEQKEESDKISVKVKDMGGKELEQAMANDLMLSVYEDPHDLLQFMPRIFHIHAKFYEMIDEDTEYSIPYKDIIPVLVEGGYSSYLSSEYEGNEFIRDTGEVDSVEQVRRQHMMFKHLLGEA